MKTGWFRVFQLSNHVSAETEIRILVDSLRNAAQELMFRLKNMRETAANSRGRLDCREANFSDIIRLIDTEATTHLVKGQRFLESRDIGVHVTYIFRIKENEGFFEIETQSQNIFDILNAHTGVFFDILVTPMEKLLIISDLDHQRHVKCLLHIFGEYKWN